MAFLSLSPHPLALFISLFLNELVFSKDFCQEKEWKGTHSFSFDFFLNERPKPRVCGLWEFYCFHLWSEANPNENPTAHWREDEWIKANERGVGVIPPLSAQFFSSPSLSISYSEWMKAWEMNQALSRRRKSLSITHLLVVNMTWASETYMPAMKAGSSLTGSQISYCTSWSLRSLVVWEQNEEKVDWQGKLHCMQSLINSINLSQINLCPLAKSLSSPNESWLSFWSSVHRLTLSSFYSRILMLIPYESFESRTHLLSHLSLSFSLPLVWLRIVQKFKLHVWIQSRIQRDLQVRDKKGVPLKNGPPLMKRILLIISLTANFGLC